MIENLSRGQIPIQQQWKRNQDYKNWGNLQPLAFKQGKPTYILPPYSHIWSFIIYYLLLLFIAFPDLICIILIIVTIPILVFTLRMDPGVKAHSIPYINQQSLIHFKHYCQKCRIFKSQQIQHCLKCQVCLQQTILHSPIVGICITNENFPRFCVLFLGLMTIHVRLIYLLYIG